MVSSTAFDRAWSNSPRLAARSETSAAKARYEAELERVNLRAERVQFLPAVGAGARTQESELRGVATIEERLFCAGEIEYPALALVHRDEVEARVDSELAVAAARVDLDAASGAVEARYANP